MIDYEHVAGILSNAAQEAFHACAVHSDPTFHLTEFIPKAAAILRESFPEREDPEYSPELATTSEGRLAMAAMALRRT